ncbi:tyrosine-type recombinase/integrase [Ralstonia syzygii]|uniref:Putative phage integrase n=1 Tax=Ralstonia syzygii R24 TaxID=907261 RepID=G3A3V4_9RALS|nr:site-specific integrase [Ralstonia syzygii]CCA88565.1 putative phage integrase [Ralstonia syzygii R24]
MTFEEVIGIYMSSVSHRSKQRDYHSLQRLQPHFGGMLMAELKRSDVRAYVAERVRAGVKPATVNRELKLLSAAINYVRIEHDRPDLANPAQRLGIGESEGRIRWISTQEATALCEAAERHARRPHLAVFIRLALNSGCRKSELIKLEWTRVSLERRLLTLHAEHTKSARRRSVPLNDAAVNALRELLAWRNVHAPGNPWVFATQEGKRITTFQKGFAAACSRAGIVDFRIHDMRHTCASWLVMAGTPLQTVRDLLGHSSVTVTERYAHLAPEQLHGAVQRILPF